MNKGADLDDRPHSINMKTEARRADPRRGFDCELESLVIPRPARDNGGICLRRTADAGRC